MDIDGKEDLNVEVYFILPNESSENYCESRAIFFAFHKCTQTKKYVEFSTLHYSQGLSSKNKF